MKKFFKERSKVLLIAAIISVILFTLLILEWMHYSPDVNEQYLLYKQYVLENKTLTDSALVNANRLVLGFIFTLSLYTMLMIASTFNVVGYIYKKTEFQLISIVLFTIALLSNVYFFDNRLRISILSIIVLNVIGYILQCKINAKKIK